MNEKQVKSPHLPEDRGTPSPKGPTRVRMPAADRQRQFVRIAFDLIAEKGFEGLRFQDVADRAGVNNATLLHRFPSKEALIQGVVHYLTSEMRAPRMGDEVATKDPIQELRREFEELGRFLEEVPAFFIVLTEIALRARRDRKTARVVEGRDKFWHQRLDELLRRGISQGVFRSDLNVEATIASLMVQVKGIAHHASLSPRGRDELPAVISEIADQVIERLTRGKSGAARP